MKFYTKFFTLLMIIAAFAQVQASDSDNSTKTDDPSSRVKELNATELPLSVIRAIQRIQLQEFLKIISPGNAQTQIEHLVFSSLAQAINSKQRNPKPATPKCDQHSQGPRNPSADDLD